MTTHTHRGTCQSCGTIQAVDNISGLLAKHGYTVEYGYFNGVCTGGEGYQPAERDVKLTQRIIKDCAERAARHDVLASDYRDGRTVPVTFERYNRDKVVTHTPKHGKPYTTRGGNDELPIAQATAEERAKAVQLAVHTHEMHSAGLRGHARGLTEHVLPRLGKSLYSVAELNAPVAKPAAPTVDVTTATVTGTFATKAARKQALERLNSQYDKARRILTDAYLSSDDRDANGATDLYYAANQLNQWRPKHSATARKLYPSLASVVDEIDALVKAREAVKAAP